MLPAEESLFFRYAFILLFSIHAVAKETKPVGILKFIRPIDELSPLIDTGNFASIANHIYLGAGCLSKKQIKDGDIIFVPCRLFAKFMKHDLPKIDAKIILFCNILYNARTQEIMGFDRSCDWYAKMLNDNRIVAWYGRNIFYDHPKAHIVPLGLGNGKSSRDPLMKKLLSNLDPDAYFNDKKIKCLVNFNCTSRRRRFLLNKLPKCEHADLFTFTGVLPFTEYVEHLKNSEYILSPRGVEPDCYRTWEALYAGTLPVVEKMGIEKVYEDLPVLIVDDFTELTVEFLDKAKKEMSQNTYKLEKLTSAYWINLILDHQKAIRGC